jgi:protein CpxP
MKALFILCIITLAALAPLPNPSFAAPPGESPAKEGPELQKTDPIKKVKWLDDLGLDDKQKEKLREIWKSKRGIVKSLREQALAERLLLKKLMSGSSSQEEVQASYYKLRSIQSLLNEIDLQSMLAVREMLTAQQRITFVEHMALRGRLGEESPNPR